MPTIAIWNRAAVRCVLAVHGSKIDVQLLDGDRLIRTLAAESAEHALTIAEMWQTETPGGSAPTSSPVWAVAPEPTPARAATAIARPAGPTRPIARRSTFAVPRSLDIERC